ncbi:MAG TPA: LytTR family DNA-binding domain-containing protein [Puia sp.]|jgi:DNA-binding LytR/AlgR family response regulator|nr:LytTR family DNA-binding domain-containing protein [Puia sp.]
MKNFKCLIVDDEPLAIDVLENYLQRFENIEIRRCENALDAFRFLKEEKFDLIFLDIEMPLLTGLDFLGTLKNPPPVIITTAYRDYAVEGFEFEALDYLVKPISFPRFVKAFERALKINKGGDHQHDNQREDNEYLFLKVDRKFVKILISEILYIESLKDYVRVTTKSTSFISYQSLTSITEKLPSDKFIRIHRSFTISIDKVNSIEGNCIQIDGKLLPISREHRQEVLRKIQK